MYIINYAYTIFPLLWFKKTKKQIKGMTQRHLHVRNMKFFFYNKHRSAQIEDLEFGFQTQHENLKTHLANEHLSFYIKEYDFNLRINIKEVNNNDITILLDLTSLQIPYLSRICAKV